MEEDFIIKEYTSISPLQTCETLGLFLVTDNQNLIIGKVNTQAEGFVMKKEKCCVIKSSWLNDVVKQMKVGMGFFAKEDRNGFESEISPELKMNGFKDGLNKKAVTIFSTKSEFFIQFCNLEQLVLTFREITRYMTTSACFSPHEIIMLSDITARTSKWIKDNEIEWTYFEEMTPQKAARLLPESTNSQSQSMQVKWLNFVTSNKELIKVCTELEQLFCNWPELLEIQAT
jgi:hypothetical protein